jgi:hypothetical protein
MTARTAQKMERSTANSTMKKKQHKDKGESLQCPNWVLVHCQKRIASKISWVQSLPFHSAIPSAFFLFIVQEYDSKKGPV